MRLTADDADPLERLELPGEARRCDPEPVRQLDPAKSLTRSVAQLEQNVSALANLAFSTAELAEIDRYATESSINLWAQSNES